MICRLQDKEPQWDERGMRTLLPNMLAQGVFDYFFGCPDMVGGGAYGGFLEENHHIDEDWNLRSTWARSKCSGCCIRDHALKERTSYERISGADLR